MIGFVLIACLNFGLGIKSRSFLGLEFLLVRGELGGTLNRHIESRIGETLPLLRRLELGKLQGTPLISLGVVQLGYWG